VQAANEGKLDDDARFRLIGPLWTLERLFYYAFPAFGMKILLHSLLASGAVRQRDKSTVFRDAKQYWQNQTARKSLVL
jgi:hypothetical protein